ncbi:auxin-responsive protein SAUR32 [Nymphaea colorata]|nr:auxin-responsive protein SAUR32 [Nymphaea colorata]
MAMFKNAARNFHKKLTRSREDVKEGHFAVLAMHEGYSKRFVVPLSYLSHPAFIRLLEEAEEEYGFYQQSILTVPCHPSELENILAGQWKKERRISSPW